MHIDYTWTIDTTAVTQRAENGSSFLKYCKHTPKQSKNGNTKSICFVLPHYTKHCQTKFFIKCYFGQNDRIIARVKGGDLFCLS